MLPENFEPKGSALRRWVYHDDNIVKYTGNRELIKEELDILKSRRTPLVISKKQFQSSSTILLDFNEKSMMVDRPAIWIPIKGRLSVTYSIKGQPHRELRAMFRKTDGRGIVLDFPYLLAESEHRQFYRVSVPSISMLVAYGNTENNGGRRIIFEGKIRDISMKGICSLTTNIYTNERLCEQTTVSELLLKLMLTSTDYFGDISINDPVIVRCKKTGLKNDNGTGYEVAFTFKPDSKTGDRIFDYMRQRELQISGS